MAGLRPKSVTPTLLGPKLGTGGWRRRTSTRTRSNESASDFQEIDFGKSDFCNYLIIDQVQTRALILDHLQWYAAGYSPHIYVMPLGSSQPKYRIDLTWSQKVEDIHRLAEDGQPSGLVLYVPQKGVGAFSIIGSKNNSMSSTTSIQTTVSSLEGST